MERLPNQDSLLGSFFFKFLLLGSQLFQFVEPLLSQRLDLRCPFVSSITFRSPAIARSPPFGGELTSALEFGSHLHVFLLPIIPSQTKRASQDTIGASKLPFIASGSGTVLSRGCHLIILDQAFENREASE